MKEREGLLLVERYVLESLGMGHKNFQRLQSETKLSKKLLMNILDTLRMKGAICSEDNQFFLNIEKNSDWFKAANSQNNVKIEVKEVLDSFVNYYYKHDGQLPGKERPFFKLRKVSMTKEEIIILRSFFYNVESYLENILKDQVKKNKEDFICSRYIVFWGEAQYQGLLEANLESL